MMGDGNLFCCRGCGGGAPTKKKNGGYGGGAPRLKKKQLLYLNIHAYY